MYSINILYVLTGQLSDLFFWLPESVFLFIWLPEKLSNTCSGVNNTRFGSTEVQYLSKYTCNIVIMKLHDICRTKYDEHTHRLVMDCNEHLHNYCKYCTANNVLFTPQHLFDNFSYYLLCRLHSASNPNMCVIYQYFWYFRLFTQALFAWFYQSNILKYLYFY